MEFEGRVKRIHSLRVRQPHQAMLPGRGGQEMQYSHGIQLSQLSREPGQAAVVMLVCGEAVVPLPPATAMANLE